uniref:PsbP C-terminal domain-containing protein n=1 Tax=Chloropicon roscoffensis TaxID=1461544 RepID=A0A7S3CD96_9CHLO
MVGARLATGRPRAPLAAKEDRAGARRSLASRAKASRTKSADDGTGDRQEHHSRRKALGLLATVGGGAGAFLGAGSSQAVQGMTAGRIPGLSSVDSDGFRTYSRPEGKMGGHGIGWSEIPNYQFRVPDGWKEEAVSIADLGGTEIDVRFAKDDEGQLAVVVAPVLRFMNVGYNADVRIEDIGPPEKVLNGFAPEILGGPVEDDDLLKEETMTKNLGGEPLTYYIWETKSHDLLSATAFKNRVFIIALRASGRQWRSAKDLLHTIQKSFVVDTSKVNYD